MKAIGRFAAVRCEEGSHPRCRCRCRGQAHGRKRNGLEDLPIWDWHNPKNRGDRDQMVLFPVRAEITKDG